MEFLMNGEPVVPVSCLKGKDCIVGIDSSKTDTGMVVLDPTGMIICDFNFRGGGYGIETYDLCYDTRNVLKIIFADANILGVAIEDVITKKSDGQDYHESRTKITAVFDNFMFWFRDRTGQDPMRVNNGSWKAEILDERYRHRNVGKGSLAWLQDIGHPLGMRGNDNTTDAYCIALYLMRNRVFRVTPKILDLNVNGNFKSKLYGVMEIKNIRNVREFICTDTSDFAKIEKALAAESSAHGFYAATKLEVNKVPLSKLFKIEFKGSIPKHVSAFYLIVEGSNG